MPSRTAISFRVLGPWEVRAGDQPVPIPAGQLRTVLSALLLAGDQPVSIGTLTGQVWPDNPPDKARGTLHTYVTRLRGLVGRDLIRTTGGGYLMDSARCDVDLHSFRRLIREASQANRAETELTLLHQALALWRGRPFGDVVSSWLDREAVPRLLEEWFSATERRIDLEIAAGLQAKLIPELTELTNRYPTREALWHRLIDALHRSGRRSEALDAYHRLSELLRDQLGIDPSDQLIQLRDSIDRDESPPAPELAELGQPAVPDQPGDRPAPRQLPHDIVNFGGRDVELAALDSRLARAAGRPGTTIISIDGAAGTGKTTLAVHWAHRVAEHYPGGQLYLNLRGYGPGEPVAPAAAMATLLRGLGVVGDVIPASTEERSGLLRSTLAGRQVLIVLDNARDSDQIRPLLPGTGCLVIVTSRNQLRGLSVRDGAHRVTLHPLPQEQAVELLANTIGPDRIAGEPAATNRLVELCDRLPLALAIVAERAHRTGALADVVSALEDEKARLDILGTGEDDPQSDLRAALSWSYRALSPPAAAMFRMLGLHPANDIGLLTAAAISYLPPGQAQICLDQLVAAHLVEQRHADRYEMHDLIRLYAMELAGTECTPEQRDEAVRRMLDWYLHSVVSADRQLLPHRRRDFVEPYQPQAAPPEFGGAVAATRWLEEEYDGLRTVLSWASANGWAGHAWRIALAMMTFFEDNIPWADGVAFYEAAHAAAKAAGETLGEAYTLNSLAAIHTDRDDQHAARSYLLQALALFQSVAHTRGEAMCHGNLGLVFAEIGEPEQAQQHLHRSLELCEQLGYPRGIALSLDNLGIALSMTGDYQGAIECHQRAHQINNHLGDTRSDAMNQHNLGRAYAAIGDIRRSTRAFRTAVKLYRSLGSRRWEAIVLTDLGKLLNDAGHPGCARTVWETAMVTMNEYADPRAQQIQAALVTMSQRDFEGGLL